MNTSQTGTIPTLRTGTRARNLRCEYRLDPLGIDVAQPRLSWVIESEGRGVVQTAYRILVSTSEEALSRDEGDLWDSGRVESDQSVHVVYSGRPLKSRQRCFWKVRAWDNHGNASEWSETARWSMGLLEKSDWKAKWIGLDGGDNQDCLINAQWIWLAGEPVATRFFRRKITIPDGREITGAHMAIATPGVFAVWVNGIEAATGRRTIFAPVSEIDLDRYLSPGDNTVAVSVSGSGDPRVPSGLICALYVEFEAGDALLIPSDASWKVTSAEVKGWQKPGFDDSQWSSAEELGVNGTPPFAKVPGDEYRRLPARMLRREFDASRGIRRATVYMCGLGLSELYINGHKVGDRVLSPGLTDYNKRCLYVTYDITDRLSEGANAVGVVLGNGRFFAPRRSTPTGTVTYGYPKLLLQMEIEYDDGSVQTIVSDDSWKLTCDGPVRENNEYDGEVYDARKQMDGWSRPGFDDSRKWGLSQTSAGGLSPFSKWQPARIVDAPAGVLSAELAEPIRAVETLRPIAITNPIPGVYIFDMGQNMVGWCRLKVRGPRGTRVYMRHAETLTSAGTLYLDNIRSAKVTDTYILKGGGVEVYEPRFTYHGFRYVELTGFPGKPDLSAIEGIVVHDAVGQTGEFACSSRLVNQIHRNILWGVRGNYRSIPTDCPQRDERQGWFGDRAQVSKGETYIFDTAALYTKWIRDIQDSQRADGSLPDLAPAFWQFYTNSVTFPTAYIVIPGHLHSAYGDLRILQTHYDGMKRWIEKASAALVEHLMPNDTYGDWCVPPESPEMIHSADPSRVTNPQLISTAYFYSDLRTIARYAVLLGKGDDAARYGQLADRVRDAFNAKFFNADAGFYDNGTQTSCVLPLAFGLVPEGDRERVFARLVESIANNGFHIGTGMIGGQWLMRVLSDNGRPDIACKLATQTTYPSWGYMLKQGATTIWELWNGDRGDPLMNSGNHVMQIGDLLTWLYEYVAGIAPDESRPGFKHVIMNPRVVGDLKSAKARHKSMYGWITSDWKISDGDFEWRIELPANTSATIFVPAGDADSVQESGVPARQAAGVRFLRMQNGRAVFEIGSGRYSFRSPH